MSHSGMPHVLAQGLLCTSDPLTRHRQESSCRRLSNLRLNCNICNGFELVNMAYTEKMVNLQLSWFYILCSFLALFCEISQAARQGITTTKSAVFKSSEFVMQPGSVINKFFYNINFPRNHIGIKDFTLEVVDERGVPVPLYDTYLHHWTVERYYQRVGTEDNRLDQSNYKPVDNAGVCNKLGQYFGLGSETQRTTGPHVPDPYAIEVGNPAAIPAGFEERWMLNIHALDTRNVVDRVGCTECRCNLYNVTVDPVGKPLRPDYEGGLACCYDKTQCKVQKGLENSPRKLYIRYKVDWLDWVGSLLPVRIYILDITLGLSEDSTTKKHQCEIEYQVASCNKPVVGSKDSCVDSKKLSFTMPQGGYVLYAAGHQHPGAIGSALYRKDGTVLCKSMPKYGNGKEAGNEEGYVVGMSSCYPQPGSVKINDGEILVLESNYNNSQKHTGAMGLFYMLVSDKLPQQTRVPEL